MITVICQTMTSDFDSSCNKHNILTFDSLDDWRNKILQAYPDIKVNYNKRPDGEFWFGLQYDFNRKQGYWFRWLYLVIDSEQGCLYSNGNYNREYGLPVNQTHMSKSFLAFLQNIELEIENRKKNIKFVD